MQQGKLDLDDAEVVEQHLPELCQQEVITSAPGRPLAYEPRKNGITVRQLLTHTSGSGYDILNPLLQAWRTSRGEQPISLSGALPEALAMPGLFQPGEGWSYGGGSDWTGLLISRLTNTNLGDFMRKEIFDIVGCDERNGFSKQEIEKHGEVIQVALRGEDGVLKPFPVMEQKGERGGGGLFASAANFIKILADLISPDPKVLSKESLDILFGPQLGEGSKALDELRKGAQVFTAMTGPLTSSLPPIGINHALGGLLIAEDSEQLGKTKGTMAWGGALNCMWFANRKEGVAAFYGSSMYPPGEGKSSELMGAFSRDVWAKIGR